MMRKIKHSNVIKIDEVYETENHIYIVMENLEGGTL